MDYKKIYNQLIERARDRISEGYVERHHVIPRCMGGSDHRDNLVDLYPEEHFFAHILLVKIYPSHPSLIFALSRMSKGVKKRRLYGWLRREHARVQSSRKMGKKRPEGFQVGREVPEETRKKISASLKGRTNGPLKEETRKKISNSNKGKKVSEETRRKLSEAAKKREQLKRQWSNGNSRVS